MSKEHARQYANDVIAEGDMIKSIEVQGSITWQLFDARQKVARSFIAKLEKEGEE